MRDLIVDAEKGVTRVSHSINIMDEPVEDVEKWLRLIRLEREKAKGVAFRSIGILRVDYVRCASPEEITNSRQQRINREKAKLLSARQAAEEAEKTLALL